MKPNPYTVVPHMVGGETKYQIHGPGLLPHKWNYTTKAAAEVMCNVFNTNAAALAKEPK